MMKNHNSIKKPGLLFFNWLIFFSALCTLAVGQDLTHYVNPFIGTSGNGHTFPGATTPFGMTQVSPETGNYSWKYCSGYQYTDSIVVGFANTHLNGTGIGDLGDMMILPFQGSGNPKISSSLMDKKTEWASPGYYAVNLLPDQIKVELSATQRTGLHRYTFNREGDSHIMISIADIIHTFGEAGVSKVSDAAFTIVNDSTINGYVKSSFWVSRQIYFSIRLSKAFKSYYFADQGINRKLIINYKTSKGQVIELRTSLSMASVAGAEKNLKAECQGKTFDALKREAVGEWNRYFSKMIISGTLDQKTQFYTAMYHLLMQPNNLADQEGNYRAADDHIYHSPGKTFYSTLSLWDTYRAAHPLYTILVPDQDADIVNSMLKHSDVAGYLPIWSLWGKDNHCMIGNHAVPVVVDACLKGLKGIDQEKAYDAIKKTLTQNHWSKYDWSIYDRFGFLPSDTVRFEAVSRTLEATYDDWCAAQLAKKLGKTEDYRFFIKRSLNYQNLYDPSTGFMRGKNRNGSWVSPFNPLLISHDYTEGNAWQYSWHVLQDPAGLVQLMGGKKFFANKLDSLFSLPSTITGENEHTHDVSGLIGQYAHGNEPSHHVAYLFNYADKAYRTQELIPEILKTQYMNKPDGLSGNDDCGQMSAWYIFSSLGFYPVNPASGIFDIGVPAYKYVKMDLNGKHFVILAPTLSAKRRYISKILLNGKKINNYQITYQQIMSGGKLEFLMTQKRQH